MEIQSLSSIKHELIRRMVCCISEKSISKLGCLTGPWKHVILNVYIYQIIKEKMHIHVEKEKRVHVNMHKRHYQLMQYAFHGWMQGNTNCLNLKTVQLSLRSRSKSSKGFSFYNIIVYIKGINYCMSKCRQEDVPFVDTSHNKDPIMQEHMIYQQGLMFH